MAKIHSAILEIEGHAHGKDRERYQQTIMDIRRAKIDGHTITDVFDRDGFGVSTAMISYLNKGTRQLGPDTVRAIYRSIDDDIIHEECLNWLLPHEVYNAKRD